VTALVSEVLKVDDSSQEQAPADKGGQQGAAAPPAETKTIAIGQTRDQVVAMFGVPSKIVQLGTKEIDVFPDMKVTFVKNKVVDVQ
jgi:outer membrane protein assembly factor BamE (lipoprotein component of BamABCDE complex)